MQVKDLLTLREDEIELLLEALDELKHKDFGRHVMKTMLHGMFSKDMSPEAKAKMEKEEELEEKQKELEMLQLRKRIDLVKAKIILIREERTKNEEEEKTN